MWDWRFERSALKVDDDEDIVPLGTMVSFWIVAMIPRCDVDVILGSYEALLVGL